TGTNLTSASTVSFGGVPAPSFTTNSDSQITATSPAGSGTVDVTVTTPSGTSIKGPADQFTYNSTPPGPPAGSPAVVTGAPSVQSSSSAGLTGYVVPTGLPTTAFFEYGLDPKYSGSGGPVLYSSSTSAQPVGSDF